MLRKNNVHKRSRNNKSSISAHEFLIAALEGDLHVVTRYVNQNEGNTKALNISYEEDINHQVIYMLTTSYKTSELMIAGSTALIFAVQNGSNKIVNYLTNIEGIDVTVLNVNGDSALNVAASKGHRHIVNTLIACKGIKINTPNVCGNTPLISASLAGNSDIVDLLVAIEEIDLNAVNAVGETALMCAAYLGRTDVVISLLAAGADVALVNLKGQNAESLAANETISTLIQNNSAERKLKLFMAQRVNEIEKEFPSEEAELEATQNMADLSLKSASDALQFIQDHLLKIDDVSTLNEVMFHLANLLVGLGPDYDEAASCLYRTSANMGHNIAGHIVVSFDGFEEGEGKPESTSNDDNEKEATHPIGKNRLLRGTGISFFDNQTAVSDNSEYHYVKTQYDGHEMDSGLFDKAFGA